MEWYWEMRVQPSPMWPDGGLGKLRHLDTNYLWIQEKAAKGDLNFKKVAGVDNGADLFTKTLSWNEMQSHIHKLSS